MKQIKLTLLLTFATFLLATISFATTFPVSNLNDSGAGSLRQAITDANADGSATAGSPHFITFSLSGQVDLTTALPNISNHITINGDVSGNTLNRNSLSDFRIFNIGSFTVEINSLILNNAKMATNNDDGGAILLAGGGTLTMNDCIIQNTVCGRFGSAYYSIGVH